MAPVALSQTDPVSFTISSKFTVPAATWVSGGSMVWVGKAVFSLSRDIRASPGVSGWACWGR